MFDDVVLPCVRQLLIDQLSFRESEVITHTDERVLGKQGSLRQVNVYPDTISIGPSPDQHIGQEWISTFNIGYTLRTGKIPDHRMFDYAYAAGVIDVFRLILIAMRRERYTLLSDINNKLAYPWKLVEPYRFSGTTVAVSYVGPDHFNADDTIDVRQEYGLFIKATYGEARFMAFVHPGQEDIVRPVSLFTTTVDQDTVTVLNASVGPYPLTYSWDFGDGTTSELRDPPPHQYTFASAFATFTITLSVTGPDGFTSVSSKGLTVSNPNPVGNLELITLSLPDLDDLDIDETDDLEVER